MTRFVNPEVQLNGPGMDPFNLSMDDVPGVGLFSLNMTNDEFQQLRDQVNDAWLNSHGLEMRCVTVEGLTPGDIIPGLGCVHDWSWTDSAMQAANIFFKHGGRVTLSSKAEITVHRAIQ